ncbi:PspC domain-containing protein [Longimycelium tulufanense]
MFENTAKTAENAARTANEKVTQAGNMLREGMDKAGVRTFRRSRTDRMLGGVCGGAAKLFGIDAALVRILLVAATLLGFGTGAVLYLVCWVLVPEED